MILKYGLKLLALILPETGILNVRKKNFILISGSPRSGTTFGAENVSRAFGDLPLVWEPLQDENLNILKVKNFPIRPVFLDIEGNDMIQKYIESLFAGKLNRFNSYIIDKKKLLNYFSKNTHAICKFTRGNAIVEELKKGNKQISVAFVVLRNPFSVISSQINHHEFKGHPACSDNSKNYELFLRAKIIFPDNQASNLAITWACDYLDAVESGVKFFYYEELLVNFHNLLDYISKEGQLKRVNEINLKKKSSTFVDRTGSDDYLKKYKRSLAANDIRSIDEVMNFFNIKYPFH